MHLVDGEPEGERGVVGAHGGLVEGELDEEAAERLLFSDRHVIELAEPDGRIAHRIVEGPQKTPEEASLVFDTEDKQLPERVGVQLVLRHDVVLASEHARPFLRQPVQLLQAARERP
ncbi:hypothetical protein [Streptomyces sp. NPDC002676]